jgi:hypothetical protein
LRRRSIANGWLWPGIVRPWGSVNIPPEVRVLLRYRKKPIVLFALLALLVAQAGAGLHALKHFGSNGDPTGVPGSHLQLCLECASFAPLASAHGGMVTTFTVAALDGDVFQRILAAGTAAHRPHLGFRSRAPPR